MNHLIFLNNDISARNTCLCGLNDSLGWRFELFFFFFFGLMKIHKYIIWNNLCICVSFHLFCPGKMLIYKWWLTNALTEINKRNKLNSILFNNGILIEALKKDR